MDKPIFDVVILGSGPAGLQAAIHASRKKTRVLMLGRMNKSSLFWAHVENFLGMFKTSGEDMLTTGLAQAKGFGAEVLEEDALHITPTGMCLQIETEGGTNICARSLVIATGTTRNRLGAPGEKELLGRGVSYCVDCDGGFFRGEDVAVVGGQSAAAGGALTLLSLAKSVHLVAERLDEIRDALAVRGLDTEFHPSYTRMVPAFHVTRIALVGCPDPNPLYLRAFDPPRGGLPPDLDSIGEAYVGALLAEARSWLAAQDASQPIGVLFSGGIDSGSVLLALNHALLESGQSSARLKAFTLSVDGGGVDAV